MAAVNELPDEAFLKKGELVRSRNHPGFVPHGRTTWDKLVEKGAAPAPTYPLGPKAPLWTVRSIREYLAKLNANAKAA